VRLWRRWL